MLVYQRAMWLKTSWWYVSTDELKHWLRKRIVRQSLRLWSGPLSMVFWFTGSHWLRVSLFAGIQCWEGLWCQEQVPKGWRTKFFWHPWGPFTWGFLGVQTSPPFLFLMNVEILCWWYADFAGLGGWRKHIKNTWNFAPFWLRKTMNKWERYLGFLLDLASHWRAWQWAWPSCLFSKNRQHPIPTVVCTYIYI